MNISSPQVPLPPKDEPEAVLPQLPADAWAHALVSAQICNAVTPAIIPDEAANPANEPVSLDGY